MFNASSVFFTARKVLFVLVCLFFVNGCALAPKYIRPDAPIPNVYATGAGETAVDLPAWDSFFRDATLQRVISLALSNNRDLRIALLNIEKTRGLYAIQRADILPTVNAVGAASSQHLPADVAPTRVKGVSRRYSASLGFSAFELDLFGRIRSLTEQALQVYHSVEADAKTARLSLVAETAAMYLQLVADREAYDLAATTAENRRKNYELVQRKFIAGVASDLDCSQAQSLWDEALVALAAAATRVGQDENHLALLMGTAMPDDLPEVRRLGDVEPLPDIPAGLPSSLLERRPDIQAAEHMLQGANANIGAARANFFPTISLTGDFGKLSADYGDLFDGSAKAWSFLPQITLPIFDTGRNLARLQVSEAERDMHVARYEKTIQTAFREVADALVQQENIDKQLTAQESFVSAVRKSYTHATVRFESGVADYLNVLNAQRMLYAAENALISTRLLREANALTLYKSLGGGWQQDEQK